MWIRCVLFYPPWLCWILFCGWDRIAILDLLFANEVVEVTVFDTENLSCRSRIFCSYGTIKILLRHVDAHFLVIASWIPPINKFSRGKLWFLLQPPHWRLKILGWKWPDPNISLTCQPLEFRNTRYEYHPLYYWLGQLGASRTIWAFWWSYITVVQTIFRIL